jgi:hypothetical protein
VERYFAGCTSALDKAMIRTIATAIALFWTAPVVTEKVEVSDYGNIDLAPFACTDTPRSTIVERVCYERTTGDLLVGIRGSYRNYCDVPPTTFDAFYDRAVDGTVLQEQHRNVRRRWAVQLLLASHIQK